MITFTEEDYYFENYMGLVYSHIINEYKLNNINTVVEFAPGFKWKIANALKNIDFNGTLYIIDSNKKVTDFIKQQYKSILPNATINVINTDLIDSIKYLPSNIDIFVANHCIDDMIISRYIKGKKLEEAFNNTEESNKILVNIWNELKEEDDKLYNIKENVYNDLLYFFENINFNFIIMSQYKSAYYMKQKNYIETLSKEVFDLLKNKIHTNEDLLKQSLNFEFADFDAALNEGFSLKENIQFYDNWIAGKYNK